MKLDKEKTQNLLDIYNDLVLALDNLSEIDTDILNGVILSLNDISNELQRRNYYDDRPTRTFGP